MKAKLRVTARREAMLERPALSREAIVERAVSIARRDGVDALTMRGLASELGTAPMSLYRHVADRHELLLLMLDRVAASLELPPVDADPRAEITALMTAAHRVFRRDAWIVPVIAIDGLASPLILPMVDRVLTALFASGLDEADTRASYALLWQFVYGEAISAATSADGQTFAKRMTQRFADDLPAIQRLLRSAPPQSPDEMFSPNLRRLLNGILGSRDP